jgi:hypothetical protein
LSVYQSPHIQYEQSAVHASVERVLHSPGQIQGLSVHDVPSSQKRHSSHCSDHVISQSPQISALQVDEQPSPLIALLSSHCSSSSVHRILSGQLISINPSPQISDKQVLEQPSQALVFQSSHCSLLPVWITQSPQNGN